MFGTRPIHEEVLVEVVHHEPTILPTRHSHDQVALVWWSTRVKRYECPAWNTLPGNCAVCAIWLRIRAHVVCWREVARYVVFRNRLVADEEIFYWRPIRVSFHVHRCAQIWSIVAAKWTSVIVIVVSPAESRGLVAQKRCVVKREAVFGEREALEGVTYCFLVERI